MEIYNKKEGTQIECPNCKYEGKAKSGRNVAIILLLFLAGFFTYGIFWIVLIGYAAFTKNSICPKCDYKHVIRK